MKQLILGSLIVIAAALSYAVPAHALNPIDITISPTSTTIPITPNKAETHTFQVYNSGTDPLTFTVSAESYYPKNLTYTPIFGQDTTRTEIVHWVSFPAPTQTIAPGKIATVSYTITPPTSIPDSAQYMVIFATTAAFRQQGISSQKQVGMLIYAHPVTGNTTETGSVTFSSLPAATQTPTIQSSTTVSNTGNTDYTAHSTLVIANAFTGQQVASLSSSKLIFPDTQRTITLSWPINKPLGLYRISQTVSLPHNNSTTSSVVLYVSPLAIIIGSSLLIALVIAVILLIHRRSAPAKHT